MDKTTKVAKAFADIAVSLGIQPPEYKRPKFWQFRKKAYLRYLDKNGLPYRLKD